jgi:hypothetical protein
VLADGDGSPVSASFAQPCHDATGGNPLLIRRPAEGLRERGVDDAEGMARLGPYAVADAVGATLTRVCERPARLAAAVACSSGRR